jgi:hypothetical protein
VAGKIDLQLLIAFRDILFFQFNGWPAQEDCLPNSVHDVNRFIEMSALSKRELRGPVLVYSR